jgi:hypothetical protein
MAFSRHTVGDQSPSKPLYLCPDSRSLTRARSLVRGRHLDVLSATLPSAETLRTRSGKRTEKPLCGQVDEVALHKGSLLKHVEKRQATRVMKRNWLFRAHLAAHTDASQGNHLWAIRGVVGDGDCQRSAGLPSQRNRKHDSERSESHGVCQRNSRRL